MLRKLMLASTSLAAMCAIAGCTSTGVGTGESVAGNVGATFTWTDNGGTSGTMTANLTNGQSYQGQFFQVTSQSQVDYSPLWTGWGPDAAWGGGWGGFPWGGGWNGWGPWGPDDQTVTHYSGRVLANLQGSGGYMRCKFTLANPSGGMAGGGSGQCQLPQGMIIDAQFAAQ